MVEINGRTVIGVIIVLTGFLLVAAVVAGVDIGGSGNLPIGGGGDQVQKCDVEASIVVTGQTTNVVFNEDSYRFSAEPASLLGLSIVNVGGTLSLLGGAENVIVDARITGENLGGSITNNYDLGTITAVESERVVFNPRKVPEGNYDIVFELSSSAGGDRFAVDQGVTC